MMMKVVLRTFIEWARPGRFNCLVSVVRERLKFWQNCQTFLTCSGSGDPELQDRETLFGDPELQDKGTLLGSAVAIKNGKLKDSKALPIPLPLQGCIFAIVTVYLVIIAGCAGKEVPPSEPMQMAEPAVAILLAPAESVTAGEAVQLRVIGFDANGKRAASIDNVEWTLAGLTGTLQNGRFTPDKSAGAQAGTVSAQAGEMKATARVRVIPALPWTEDFEAIERGKSPSHWIGTTGKFFVREGPAVSPSVGTVSPSVGAVSNRAGTVSSSVGAVSPSVGTVSNTSVGAVSNRANTKVLVKTPVARGLNRSNVYLGPPTMRDYTIQVDLMGTKNKRRLPDMGLIANRYTLDMQGRHQRLQIRSWASDLRMAKTSDFPWETDVWYTMKMQVEVVEGRRDIPTSTPAKAIIRGKVWRTGEPEPENWTLIAEDPRPNREGSPGIYGYSATEIYYDNLKVW